MSIAKHGELKARRAIVTDNVYETFEDAVGNTPLIKLRRASAETQCDIYGKMEFLNPGGSVKDRAALYIILDAEERGLLTPGKPGVIVEGTAGNTGIGLALVAAARGYQCVIVIPRTQSQEKKDMIRIAGAQLVEVDAVPYRNPNNYVRLSGRLAKELGAFWANQFDNVANKRAHVETTGPEIFAQTGGKVDGFSCAIGTGGTIAGVAQFLREKKPDIKIALTDPKGAALVSYFNSGELRSAGSSITEGIGQGRVTANIEGFTPDYALEIDDADALVWTNQLLAEEGLCVGTSSAINVAGAVELAKRLGPGHTVVTILCDLGTRYASKMFNAEFLHSKNLPLSKCLLRNEALEVAISAALDRATVKSE
mmetsp:Transcript_9798/g.26101  ORF Transcript_9798/g.26101 Transcript_9798/m.26101 type:complete len:368 (+) Transcript_9798:36-1139(+)